MWVCQGGLEELVADWEDSTSVGAVLLQQVRPLLSVPRMAGLPLLRLTSSSESTLHLSTSLR